MQLKSLSRLFSPRIFQPHRIFIEYADCSLSWGITARCLRSLPPRRTATPDADNPIYRHQGGAAPFKTFNRHHTPS
nr:MAG TPA: hypothetical protein [Inoviridae sp.]